MITVTCVAPERRLLALLPHDRVGLLEQFLRELPASVRSKIRAVCIDLKEGWRRAVERALPGVPIVADPFHVIQDANRRVDEARRVEQELIGQRIPRWPLVKNEEDLTERQAAQLAAIRQRHKNVAHLHWVKEQLRDVYRASSREEAFLTLVLESLPLRKLRQQNPEASYEDVLNDLAQFQTVAAELDGETYLTRTELVGQTYEAFLRPPAWGQLTPRPVTTPAGKGSRKLSPCAQESPVFQAFSRITGSKWRYR